MVRRGPVVTFLAGAATGLVVALAFLGRPAEPAAVAQQQVVPPATGPAPGRYAVAAWGTPAEGRGAYVLDPQTGALYSVRGDNPPGAITRGAMPRP